MSRSTLTLHVPDMSCGHCRASIESALKPMNLKPEFDMPSRRVTLSGGEPAAVLAALERIGFPAEVVGS